MGCVQSGEKEESNGTSVPIGSTDAAPKTVDPRLPFDTYRQLFQMKNSWKAVTRALERTAVNTLVRFFQEHPEHQALHKKLASLDSEEKMRESTAFETEATEMFNVLDEAMECIEKEMVDAAIAAFKRFGQSQSKIEGLSEAYYKDMEAPFLKSVEETLGDRYTDPTAQNFTRFYQFATSLMVEGLTGQQANRI